MEGNSGGGGFAPTPHLSFPDDRLNNYTRASLYHVS